MKRLMILLLALMMLSPSMVAAQEMTWSEGFDPSSPDCEAYAEDCENLIAWLISQDGVEAPTPTPTPASVDAPMGGWAFVEDYRLRMMDAAEFICLDPAIQKNLRTGWDPDTFEPHHGIMQGHEDAPVFFSLQAELASLIQAERNAGTPIPEGMEIPNETYELSEILEFLEDERDFHYCTFGGHTL